MFELKVASPDFILAALEAGKTALFEGTILILTRGLGISHQKELLSSWSDLDDATHKDILVLTFGISKKHSGITASSIMGNIVADEVSVAYPTSESFSSTFQQLLQVAEHVPYIYSNSRKRSIDSHRTTDIRRWLGLAERQIPALFIVSYRQREEYVVELGSDEMQVSPAKFISALVRNLDDRSSLLRGLFEKKRWQLKEKRRRIDKLAQGNLEELLNYVRQTLVDKSDDLRGIEEQIIKSLIDLTKFEEQTSSFPDGQQFELRYESNLIKYALSLEQAISRIEEQQRSGKLEMTEKQLTSLQMQNIETAFKSAIENTLKQFSLEPRRQDSQGNNQVSHVFDSFTRRTYSQEIEPDQGKIYKPDNPATRVISGYPTQNASKSSTKDRVGMRNQVFISYSHKDDKWLKRLQVHLKPLERMGTITRWDATSIQPGNKWNEEIEKAIALTKVAVLLISADFLSSDFISTNELPPVLDAVEKEGAIILPVIVSPCLFQHISNLSQFQSVNSPDRPLSAMTKNEQEVVFVKIAKTIENVFHS